MKNRLLLAGKVLIAILLLIPFVYFAGECTRSIADIKNAGERYVPVESPMTMKDLRIPVFEKGVRRKLLQAAEAEYLLSKGTVLMSNVLVTFYNGEGVRGMRIRSPRGRIVLDADGSLKELNLTGGFHTVKE